MRQVDRPEIHEREGHIYYPVIVTCIDMFGGVSEGTVDLLWDRTDPWIVSMNVEIFPGSQIVMGSGLPCSDCEEIIAQGQLAVPDLEKNLCTTCAPIQDECEAVWTVSFDQLHAALEDRADRPKDEGDIRMNRHLGSRLQMRLFNGTGHTATLDFNAHRLEQFVQAVRYYQACHGADELTQAFIEDGIRKFEEFLAE